MIEGAGECAATAGRIDHVTDTRLGSQRPSARRALPDRPAGGRARGRPPEPAHAAAAGAQAHRNLALLRRRRHRRPGLPERRARRRCDAAAGPGCAARERARRLGVPDDVVLHLLRRGAPGRLVRPAAAAGGPLGGVRRGRDRRRDAERDGGTRRAAGLSARAGRAGHHHRRVRRRAPRGGRRGADGPRHHRPAGRLVGLAAGPGRAGRARGPVHLAARRRFGSGGRDGGRPGKGPRAEPRRPGAGRRCSSPAASSTPPRPTCT